VAVINDLGNGGGSQRLTTAGNDMDDYVGNDLGDRDDGGNKPSDNAGKGDGGDAGREGGGGPGGRHGGGSSSSGGGGSGNGSGGGCTLQGFFAFYCKDIFVRYFYDVWGELARSNLPSHYHHT
jgi:hypothetical protein